MPKNKQTEFDYLIAGAGIAGLYTAYKLHKKYPSARICILEKSIYIGGRLHTINYDGVKVDGGGARFNTEQYRILSLIRDLELSNKMVPINNISVYKPVNPRYNSQLETLFPTIDDFIKDLKKKISQNSISKTKLINSTISTLADKLYSKTHPTIKTFLISRYPYYSELNTLNSLEGINLFDNEFADKMQYFVLAGGLEQLPSTIYHQLKISPQITIKKETPLLNISRGDVSLYNITTPDEELQAHNVILALPEPALLKIPFLINGKKNVLDIIKSVQPEPLYRIYARYPVDKKTGKVWFDGMTKIITNLPIKYIIPIDYKKGVIMISYTDGKFADYWIKKMSEGYFETELNKQLKMVFPDKNIPKAKWYKHCPWIMGASYWKPGYNRSDILPKMIQPLKDENVFICGENYSSHQAWVEGSLETADLVLQKCGIPLPDYSKTKYTYAQPEPKSLTHFKKTLKRSTEIGINYLKSTKKSTTGKLSKKHNIYNNQVEKSREDNIEGGGKMKEYTMEEVKKHNKKTDAWIVIDGKVANVTDWIPKHPGGDIIMKGVGKDATQLFHGIGHDKYALKMLKKYQIGILTK